MKASTRKYLAGKEGEKTVYDTLAKIENKVIIPNLLYKFESAFQNSSHQIDFILLTTKNIYLIEVKSYRKVLEYEFEKENWVIEYHKTGDKERRRNGIDNPIFQNRNHRTSFIQIVKNVPAEHVLAISVVLTDSDLLDGRKWKLISKTDILVSIDYLQEFVEKCEEKCKSIIEIEEVLHIILKMPSVDIYKHNSYCEQIGKAKKIIKRRNDLNFDSLQFEEKHCKCGSKMFIRTGYNSIFWGCSNFPVCTNTERI